MNRSETSPPPARRMPRIVSLPCGHAVDVEADASLIALSGPVLEHQAICPSSRTARADARFLIDGRESRIPVRGRAPEPVHSPWIELVAP